MGMHVTLTSDVSQVYAYVRIYPSYKERVKTTLHFKKELSVFL